MFDIAPSEFLLVAVIALVVIGPKDLPKAMRVLGHWVGRARGVARQFRSGFDSMVREAELAELEKMWADENARIMSEHGAGGNDPTASDGGVPAVTSAVVSSAQAGEPVAAAAPASEPDLFPQPVMVEKPVVAPAPADAAPAPDARANS